MPYPGPHQKLNQETFHVSCISFSGPYVQDHMANSFSGVLLGKEVCRTLAGSLNLLMNLPG